MRKKLVIFCDDLKLSVHATVTLDTEEECPLVISNGYEVFVLEREDLLNLKEFIKEYE